MRVHESPSELKALDGLRFAKQARWPGAAVTVVGAAGGLSTR
jgi:hypothetical protein